MNVIQKLGAKILGIDAQKDFLPLDQNQLFRQLFKYYGQNTPVQPEFNMEEYIRQGYNYNFLIYSIVSFIARKASKVEYKAYRYTKGGQKEELPEHPILESIYAPNSYQGKSEFLEQYHGFKLLTGNSYIYTPILDSGINRGKFTEMHVMPAHWVEIVSGGMFNPVGGYRLRYGDDVKPFDVDEVLHSKYANYYYDNGENLYGQSPIQAAWPLLQKSNSNIAAAKSSFDNKGAQGVLFDKSEVTSNGMRPQLTEEQFQKMQARWDKKIRGPKNKGRILMTAGDFGYIDLGMSPVDLALISDSQATKRDICDIFHVPSILFNDPEGTTYNNQQEVRKRAWTDAIMPECDHFADEFTRHAKNAYKSEGDIWVVADYSAIEELQADKREMIEWLERAWWIKGSKKQEIMGIEPDEELDKYFIPMGLVPSDELNIDPTIFEQAKEENLDYFRKKN